MAEFRTLLAAALGVGLGVVFLAVPEAIVRAQTAGRVPHDRRGEYGDDDVPARWQHLVRVAGIVLIAAGLYFGRTVLV